MSDSPVLFSQDLSILLQLASKAPVQVGDISKIIPSLQRFEQAVLSGKSFVALEAPKAEQDGYGPSAS